MPVRVLIPTPLQRLTENQAEVVVEGSDVREMIGNLEGKFPGVKASPVRREWGAAAVCQYLCQ